MSGFWDLASSAAKFLGMLAMAGVTGGTFSLGLAAKLRMAQDGLVLRYVRLSAVVGLIAAGLSFLVQIGAVNQNGIAGMFDRTMIGILATSGAGYTAALRILGFGCVAAAVWALRGSARALTVAAAVIVLGFSFSLTGHMSELGLWPRVGIVLHVLAAFLWVGALYPLLRLGTVERLIDVKRLMILFGSIAVGIVGLLLLSGVFLLTRNMSSINELFTTAYGLGFLAKLSGVAGLLVLAATNKLLLVPNIPAANSTHSLRLSIRTEILVACFVLAVTAWVTTAVGPAH